MSLQTTPHATTHPTTHPVRITTAAPSFDEEFAARKRRYSLIMAMRIPCLVLAGVCAIGFGWTLPAVLLIAASVPLPWVAVLIANDGPPRRADTMSRLRRHHRSLPTATPTAIGSGRVIDVPAERPSR